MAFTYIGSSSNAGDGVVALQGATAAAKSTSRTLNAGAIQAGDVVILGTTDSSGLTISISNTASQSWNALSLVQDLTNFRSHRVYWCQASGAFATDPSTIPGSDGFFEAYSVYLHVFRPTAPGNIVSLDVAQFSSTFADPGSPFDLTIAGQTTVNTNSFTFALVNQYGVTTNTTLTAGWGYAGAANQLRNSNQSTACLYKLNTVAGATGSVTTTQATNHSQGQYSIFTLSEPSAFVAPPPRRPFNPVYFLM